MHSCLLISLLTRTLSCAQLRSDEVTRIMDGKLSPVYGISFLRKICNHPDLLQREHKTDVPDYGNFKRSAKMAILHEMVCCCCSCCC